MEVMNKDPKKRIILTNDNDEKRNLFETCNLKAEMVVNPIIDWSDDDVWEYIESEKLPYNPLYCEGWKRVGCIGCPLAGGKMMQKEFARWPKYQEMYIAAFDRMLQARKDKEKETVIWKTGVDVFHWWIGDGVVSGQIGMEELLENEQ